MSVPTVFVVDDDDAVRRALSRMLGVAGYEVTTLASAESFLESYDPDCPGCLILDVRMPGMDGLELQQKLTEQSLAPPVIILTAHADVPMAVGALHDGAVDFIEKPFEKGHLLERIDRALQHDARRRQHRSECAVVEARLNTLTPREREVLDLLVEGLAVKQIAVRLGTQRHTVKHQRASLLKKMEVMSEVELVNAVALLRSES